MSTVIILFLIFSQLYFQCLHAQKRVPIKMSGACTTIQREIAGLNAALVRESLSYDNPVLEHYLAKRNIASIRFPGGSASDFYDWETGKEICPTNYNCTSLCNERLLDNRGCGRWIANCSAHADIPDRNIRRVKDGYLSLRSNLNVRRLSHTMPITELNPLLLSNTWKGSVVFVVNPCISTLAKTKRLAQYFMDFFSDSEDDPAKRVKFEIGNELFFRKHDYCLQTSVQYEKLATDHAREIKKVNPNFLVSVIATITAWNNWVNATVEDFPFTQPPARIGLERWRAKRLGWNLFFPKENFMVCANINNQNVRLFDAVTAHFYPDQYESNDELSEQENEEGRFRNVISQIDSKLEIVIQDLVHQFKVPVWVSEWDAGISSPGYFGSLARTLFFMRMLSTPDITEGNFHMVNSILRIQDFDGQKCQYAEDFVGDPFNGSPKEREAEFLRRTQVQRRMEMHFDIFSVIPKQCWVSQKLEIEGVGQYTGTEKYAGTYDEVLAILLRCSDGRQLNRVVVLTKTSTAYTFDLSGILEGVQDTPTVTLYQMNPEDRADYIVENKEVETEVTVPGYSVAVISGMYVSGQPFCLYRGGPIQRTCQGSG